MTRLIQIAMASAMPVIFVPGEDDQADDNGNGVPDCQEVMIPEDLYINEIRIDQPSSDHDEYVELVGPEGTDLNGFTYIVIGDGSGGSGSVEAIINLTGVIGDTGKYLVAESTFSLEPGPGGSGCNHQLRKQRQRDTHAAGEFLWWIRRSGYR